MLTRNVPPRNERSSNARLKLTRLAVIRQFSTYEVGVHKVGADSKVRKCKNSQTGIRRP